MEQPEPAPKAVPLTEQLRSVPLNAVLRIDTPNALGCMDTRSIPVGRFCREAADALAACPEPAPNWQPIETAPQTGYMLVHEDGAIRALFRYEGTWKQLVYPTLIHRMWPLNPLVGSDAERILEPLGYQLGLGDGCCENPTHWMPLPSPPKDQK